MNPDKLSAGDWFFGKVLCMGANWRTTVSGIGSAIAAALTVLGLIPYELGSLGDIFSPKVKAFLVSVGLFATTVLRIWNAFSQKDRNVTGGQTQQTVDGDLAKPGTQNLVDATLEAKPAAK
jgi:hypothetical protein